MHFVRESLPLIGSIGRSQSDDLIDQDPLAGRPARMDAVIAIGVIGAGLVKNADLVLAGGDDAPVAIRQLRCLGHAPFRHRTLLPRLSRCCGSQYRVEAPLAPAAQS